MPYVCISSRFFTRSNNIQMIYISGKITDENPIVQKENMEKFYVKEKELGVPCYNPAKNGNGDNKIYEYYLAMDVIWIIQNSPSMYMMTGWEDSRGARLEHEIALQMGLEIEYE